KAARQLVMEVLVAMHVLAVEPYVGWAVGRQHAADGLSGRAEQPAVRPGTQIVADMIERRANDEVIVSTTIIVPDQARFAGGERFGLDRRFRDARIDLVKMASDLPFPICALEALQVEHGDSLRAGDEPVVDITVDEFVADEMGGHGYFRAGNGSRTSERRPAV